ncbi:hypothetical protein B9Z55_028386 [Caenorhabditis nigoni]|uniref:Uncharacterized protein n=1 Tax=Caenorhabditis nigoni TaxID=1611254 RepID=A0A2G5SC85_9PELO|nr:hypothetical protein B9Z55_028386 [Caenorhabditis nigoni]
MKSKLSVESSDKNEEEVEDAPCVPVCTTPEINGEEQEHEKEEEEHPPTEAMEAEICFGVENASKKEGKGRETAERRASRFHAFWAVQRALDGMTIGLRGLK